MQRRLETSLRGLVLAAACAGLLVSSNAFAEQPSPTPTPDASSMPGATAPSELPSPATTSGTAVPAEPAPAPAEPPTAKPAPTLPASPPPNEAVIGATAAQPATPAPETKPSGNSYGGFLDFNVYPYLTEVKTDSVFTLNAASKLAYGFSYASLLNIANQDAAPFDDTNGYHTEQNLRWSFPAPIPFDLTMQYNMRSGIDNDRLRFGFRWRADGTPGLGPLMKAIGLTYSITFHALQFDHEDHYVWQIEHIFRLDPPHLDRRLYIGGFVDHQINQDLPGMPKHPAVIEVQGGVRLIEEFYAIAEYRVNQYREPTPLSQDNLALGAEYVVKW